jgi:membrane protease YdiL (CAAX protease family)
MYIAVKAGGISNILIPPISGRLIMEKNYCVIRRIWRLLYPAILTVAIQLALGFILSIIIIGKYSNGAFDSGYSASESFETIINSAPISNIMTISNSLCLLIVFFPLWYISQKRTEEPYANKNIMPAFGLIVIFSVSLQLILTYGTALIDIYSIFPAYKEVSSSISNTGIPIEIIFGCILAPIAEECTCRGLILNRALKWMPKWVAIVVSSLIFAILHGNLFQGLYAFLGGAITAVIYVKFRTLWAPIIEHIAFNLSSVVIGMFPIWENSQHSIVWTVLPLSKALPVLIPSVLVFVASGYVLLIKMPSAVKTDVPAVDF